MDDWECIIVNDGSTDDSQIIANQWVEKDARFQLVSIDNAGVSNARNQGILRATGTYILPLDADDYLDKNYIKSALQIFQNSPSCKVVYGSVMLIGERNERWNLPEFSMEELAMSNIIPVTGIYRKTDWVRIKGYDLQLKKGLEDWEFWINLLKENPKVHYLEEITFYYRIKKDSRNTAVDVSAQKEIQSYIVKKHLDFYMNTFGTYQELAKTLKFQNMELNSYKKSFSFKIFKVGNLVKKRLKNGFQK
ncbi:beta-1,3-glucosyltransferase [Nonlabens ulvanivorans]|uniref:Beta-1,3-glucosyltransferase n=1 Tax=Nonlabens ulvanivorans TaxID=906888 RepID=A0A090QC47_NONUL|nr:beta-1,3-glucosyltransferase [Nonlabens ulvanivorans]